MKANQVDSPTIVFSERIRITLLERLHDKMWHRKNLSHTLT